MSLLGTCTLKKQEALIEGESGLTTALTTPKVLGVINDKEEEWSTWSRPEDTLGSLEHSPGTVCLAPTWRINLSIKFPTF